MAIDIFLSFADCPSASRVSSDKGVVVSSSRFKMLRNICHVPWCLPDEKECKVCQAFRFYSESAGFCCACGQVKLAQTVKCDILWSLFMDATSEVSQEFRRRSRSYNSAFAFTTLKADFEDSWWPKDGVYSLKVHGQVTHFFKPISGQPNTREMMQLFFIDTAEDLTNDVLLTKDLRRDVVEMIASALSTNPYSLVFKRLRSWNNLHSARIVIRSSCVLDQRNCNVPIVDQVAGVWKDGEKDTGGSVKDIQVYMESGRNQKINYYCGAYDSLQYLLLYPLGEPGWDKDIHKVDCGSGQ